MLLFVIIRIVLYGNLYCMFISHLPGGLSILSELLDVACLLPSSFEVKYLVFEFVVECMIIMIIYVYLL